jgi:hypothetical protein
MEKAGVDSDIARLTGLERAHQEEQQRLRTLVSAAQERAEATLVRADRIAALAERTVDTSGDKFAMTVDGRRHAKRAEAGEHLRDVLVARLAATPLETTVEHQGVAQLAGIDIDAETTTVIENDIRLRVPDTEIDLRYVEDEWRTADIGMLVQRLERRIHRLPEAVANLRADAQAATDEAARADALLGRPWEHTEELARLRRRQQELDETLTVTGGSPQQPDAAVAQVRERLDRTAAQPPASAISV